VPREGEHAVARPEPDGVLVGPAQRRDQTQDAVDRVIGLVDRAEYKRRQAPPGIKITPRAFGRDRRMPITNRYRG